ncbi:MAG: ATP-binding cassette domain-containing protein [Geminicoccaceae bacterium]
MKRLSKIFPGGKKILENVTLAFLPGAKIGVLGVNGAGKSTVLRIMAGQDQDFSGEAWAADGVKVGYLEQEPHLDPEKDVLGNVMDGVAETKALLDRFNEVSNQFAEPDADFDALMAEQADLQKDRRLQWLGNRAHTEHRHGRAALSAGRCRRDEAFR